MMHACQPRAAIRSFSMISLIFVALATPALSAAGSPQKPQKRAALRFEVSFPAAAHDGPITGRVFVMIAKTGDREPRLQIGRTGTPLFGRDVERLRPGQPALIDETDLGTPIESLRDIPAGDYVVQALVNVYSEFKRADGHVVWMHDDQWEGQRWETSPGNLYSLPQKMRLDASSGYRISLVADQKIPPVVVPPDT